MVAASGMGGVGGMNYHRQTRQPKSLLVIRLASPKSIQQPQRIQKELLFRGSGGCQQRRFGPSGKISVKVRDWGPWPRHDLRQMPGVLESITVPLAIWLILIWTRVEGWVFAGVALAP